MKRLSDETKAGLYITAIVHVAVIIVLLVTQIGSEWKRENAFVLDFTKMEEKEREAEEKLFKELTAERLEELIAAAQGIPIRNVTVDRASLKDDRGTNAEELYKEAERLARDLRDGQNRAREEDEIVAAPVSRKDEPRTEQKPYTGPSVLSWSLDGRKASHLPIPAYRCYGAGEVTVIIAVNNRGDVINAKVEESSSSKDNCLQSYAIRAARLSKFSSSQTAPSRQMGTITYAFIAQ
ncbi:MAG: energy transducer TonB [Bacteroidales bacterium]|nr:energy transducer TonB [Bacteroidales bacterium]